MPFNCKLQVIISPNNRSIKRSNQGWLSFLWISISSLALRFGIRCIFSLLLLLWTMINGQLVRVLRRDSLLSQMEYLYQYHCYLRIHWGRKGTNKIRPGEWAGMLSNIVLCKSYGNGNHNLKQLSLQDLNKIKSDKTLCVEEVHVEEGQFIFRSFCQWIVAVER